MKTLDNILAKKDVWRYRPKDKDLNHSSEKNKVSERQRAKKIKKEYNSDKKRKVFLIG